MAIKTETPLFKSLDVTTSAQEQFWLDALPSTTTKDSYKYLRELNPGSLGASQSPETLNHDCISTGNRIKSSLNLHFEFMQCHR